MAYAQRTADWVIQKAFLHAQRKATAPASGTTKYNALLSIVDSMQKLWADEAGTVWNSLYNWDTQSVLVSATDTFALDTTVQYISREYGDYVRLVSPDGTVTKKITLVEPDSLYTHSSNTCYVAQIGRTLKFSKAFAATDSVIGYSIIVPAYGWVNDIATGTDPIVVDDPMWVAYMSAAEFIRNDPVRQNQYQNLVALAEQCMDKMKENNDAGLDIVPMGSFATGETWV